MKAGLRSAFVAALALTSACTVHGTDVPGLTGPSEAALSMVMTVTPDTLVQDGLSQATLNLTAFDASGKAKSGQTFRLDIEVPTSAGTWDRHDFGTLSTRLFTTGSDGRASAVFTTPLVTVAGFEERVRFVATAVGTDAVATSDRGAELRLVPPSGYQASGPVPRADFFITPTPVYVNVPVFFNGTGSCAETPAANGLCSTNLRITEFIWDFGDGTSGTGYVASHQYATEGTYTVSLRVVNSRGVHNVTSKTVDVKFAPPPTAEFSVGPTPLRAGTIALDASLSQAGPGRSIVKYDWFFNASYVGSGVTLTVNGVAAGGYTVTLAVYDDTGQKTVKSANITVAP